VLSGELLENVNDPAARRVDEEDTVIAVDIMVTPQIPDVTAPG
jgi:hypothetical protein